MGKHQSVVYYRSRVVALGSEINKHSERPSRNFYDFHFKQWHCYCIFTPIWIVETCDGHLHFIFRNYCIWRVLTQTGMRKSALYAVFSSLPLNGFFFAQLHSVEMDWDCRFSSIQAANELFSKPSFAIRFNLHSGAFYRIFLDTSVAYEPIVVQ